ncbi:hypothetical protein VCSRO103_2663 [Vibrio cholerae]|nr:hypothetical protein VCSRO103_2663 [Vibrio cholerae]
MKSKIKKLHMTITIMSSILLMIIYYTMFFQPTFFYETNYKYETNHNNYQHDVNMTMSIKGIKFTSNIIVRTLGINGSKNYFKVDAEGHILRENTHQYYLAFDKIDVYTGTSKANIKRYDKQNSANNLIEKLNNVKILYLSEEYIIVALFSYNGQIITLHRY